MPQHIKLTNMFEASMQAVNPAVTMPYWDFTMDVAEGKTIYESVMFTDKTFGTITKPAALDLGFTYANDALESTAIQGTTRIYKMFVLLFYGTTMLSHHLSFSSNLLFLSFLFPSLSLSFFLFARN